MAYCCAVTRYLHIYAKEYAAAVLVAFWSGVPIRVTGSLQRLLVGYRLLPLDGQFDPSLHALSKYYQHLKIGANKKIVAPRGASIDTKKS